MELHLQVTLRIHKQFHHTILTDFTNWLSLCLLAYPSAQEKQTDGEVSAQKANFTQ